MEITAKQLAALVHGTVDGDELVVINNYAKIEEATSGCLTFLANPKYTHYIYTTQATAVHQRVVGQSLNQGTFGWRKESTIAVISCGFNPHRGERSMCPGDSETSRSMAMWGARRFTS